VKYAAQICCLAHYKQVLHLLFNMSVYTEWAKCLCRDNHTANEIYSGNYLQFWSSFYY